MKKIFPNSTLSDTQRSSVARPITLPMNTDSNRDCYWTVEKKFMSVPGFLHLDTNFYHLKMSYLNLLFAHDIQGVVIFVSGL